MLTKITKFCTLIVALVGLLTPFLGYLSSIETYKQVFVLYKLRVEILIFAIFCLVALFLPKLLALLRPIWKKLLVAGYDFTAQNLVYAAALAIPFLAVVVLPTWGDAGRWLIKRVQYLDSEVALDYSNFLDYSGVVAYRSGELSRARSTWDAMAMSLPSVPDAIVNKISLVDDRKELSRNFLESVKEHEGRLGGRNLLSYRLAAQSLVADPDSSEARAIVDDYLRELLVAQATPCEDGHDWYVTGQKSFDFAECEKFISYGHPDNKWLLESVRQLLLEMDKRGVEGISLAKRISEFNDSTVALSAWDKTDQTLLQRYMKRVVNFGFVEQDLFVEKSFDEFYDQ